MEEIVEALETPSKGRLKVIQAAHEAFAFVDKKLAEVALRAVDDKNAKVADYVASTILPTLGPKNHKWLMQTSDPKNIQRYARRITLMQLIDPLATQPLVRTLAKESKSPVITALAIECLGASHDNFEFLTEIHRTRHANCFWALSAIARMATPESDVFVIEQLKNDNLFPLTRVAEDVRPAGLVEAAIPMAREMLSSLSSESEVSFLQSRRFRELIDIATAGKIPFRELSSESEELLMHCLNFVPTLLMIDSGSSSFDMVFAVMQKLTYRGSRVGCMYMIEHRDRLPKDHHSFIATAAKRHLSPEEREALFPSSESDE